MHSANVTEDNIIIPQNHTNRELMDKYWEENPLAHPSSSDQAVEAVKKAVYHMQRLNVKVAGDEISNGELKVRILDLGFG